MCTDICIALNLVTILHLAGTNWALSTLLSFLISSSMLKWITIHTKVALNNHQFHKFSSGIEFLSLMGYKHWNKSYNESIKAFKHHKAYQPPSHKWAKKANPKVMKLLLQRGGYWRFPSNISCVNQMMLTIVYKSLGLRVELSVEREKKEHLLN